MPPYTGTVEIEGKAIHWETTFPDSIRFKCVQCGDSCMGTRVSLYPSDMLNIDKQYIQLPMHPSEPPQLKKKQDDSCVFLQQENHNNCTIYPNRPLVCREFPFKVQFMDETHACIDMIRRCSALTLKEHPTKNQMDFGDLVKRNYMRLNTQPPTLTFDFGKEKDEWKKLVSTFDGDIFALQVLVAKRQQHIRKTFVPEETLWEGFVKKIMHLMDASGIVYRGRELETLAIYYINAERKMLAVRTEEELTIIDPKVLLHPLPFTSSAQRMLKEYLEGLWDRKTTQIDLHFATKIVSLSPEFLLCEASRRMLIMLQFFLEIIARKNDSTSVTDRDVHEAIFLLDAPFFTPMEGIDFSKFK